MATGRNFFLCKLFTSVLGFVFLCNELYQHINMIPESLQSFRLRSSTLLNSACSPPQSSITCKRQSLHIIPASFEYLNS